MRAPASERDALRSELSDYLTELAALEDASVEPSPDGSPAYRWFDHYWAGEGRIPLVIELSGEIAGLCLVRVMDGGWNLAEFGVRPEWRRRGVGRRSVELLADAARAAGASHLRADVRTWNERAIAFWAACGLRPAGRVCRTITTRRPLDPAA